MQAVRKEPDQTPKLISTLRGQPSAKPPIWLMRQAGRYLPEYRELRAKAAGFLDLCYRHVHPPRFGACGRSAACAATLTRQSDDSKLSATVLPRAQRYDPDDARAADHADVRLRKCGQPGVR